MKPKLYEATAAALDAEAWDWVESQFPVLAEAPIRDVELGATPDGMRLFALRYAGPDRDLLAKRLELAVRFLQREEN